MIKTTDIDTGSGTVSGRAEHGSAGRMLARYADALRTDAGIPSGSLRDFVVDAHAADHAFYLRVVPMLSRCFPTVDATTVETLGCAFYGIFRMVLAMDRVVDRQESGYLYDGLVHYTVAVRRLSTVFPSAVFPSADFPPDSPVWTGLAARLHHSIDQIRIERELSPDDERDAFASVAAGKSSLIQLTVDWLDALAPAPGDLAERLRRSLIDKHLGMQWLDDINDFVADAELGQPTWARARLAAHARANGIALDAVAPLRQKRLLFASGLGEALLAEANAHFAAALDGVAGIDLPEYTGTIRNYIDRTGRIIAAIAEERAAAQQRLERNHRTDAEHA